MQNENNNNLFDPDRLPQPNDLRAEWVRLTSDFQVALFKENVERARRGDFVRGDSPQTEVSRSY